MKKQNKKRNLFLRIFDLRYFFYDFVKFTGAIPVILYFRVKTYYLNGKKPKGLFKGPIIFVSNHMSFLDPVIVSIPLWKRRVSFIATKDLFEKKFWNFFFNAIKCIPVNKRNVEMRTFKLAKEAIQRGHTILIFPEGTVESKDEISSFKSGAVMFSLLCDAPIVQIYLEKKTKWYKRQRLIIGNKIDVSKILNTKYPTMDEIQKVTEMLYNQEIELSNAIKLKNNK